MAMEGGDSSRIELREWIDQLEQLELGGTAVPGPTEEQPKNDRRCIYRLPANIVRNEQDDDPNYIYRPYKVSFGPYHHGDECCLAGEWVKEASLRHSLEHHPLFRNGSFHYYAQALGTVVEELKEAYNQLDPVWQQDTDAFLTMMIIDGFFLLELLSAVRGFSNNPVMQGLLENPREMEFYRHDMLLLENQIPMIVFAILLYPYAPAEAQARARANYFLGELTEVFFSIKIDRRTFECKHILDVYHQSLMYKFRGRKSANMPQRSRERRRRRRKTPQLNIPSAKELHGAGIGLTTTETTISFHRKTLLLPPILVDGATKSLFLNLIAFERLHEDAGTEVTSYIYFMRTLIQDANDVSPLKLRGIINTTLPSDEVARLFDRMSKDTFIDPDHEFFELGRKLRERFNKMSNEWRKDLYQKYLKSPWTIISVIAASLIFTLSIIQTVYTVLSYVNRNK